MTAQTRTVNKNRFEQGDTPQGSDFVDLIDSFVALSDTTAQTIVSKVIFSGGLDTPLVSANAVNAISIIAGSAQVRGGIGIGTAAPTQGLFIATSSETALVMDIVTTTKASGGTGGAVPVSAQGFFTVQINGTKFYVPFFNVKA